MRRSLADPSFTTITCQILNPLACTMSTRSTDPLPLRLTLSALSAAASESLTYPLDLLKTRLQLAHGKTRVRSVAGGGVYSGLGAAVLRHVPYSSIRVVAFESLKAWNWGGTAGTGPNLPSLLAFGFFSGGIAQLVGSPFDLVKVRMQADRSRYRSVLHALKEIGGQQGIRGMWRGAFPAVQRAAIVNLGELSTYDAAKRFVLSMGVPDGAASHALGAVCSGFVSSLLSNPADVVKSRIMNQDPSSPTYKGTVDCFLRTFRNEGFAGLYKGFFFTWARLGPWQLVFWVTYEKLRGIAGMGGF